MTIRERVQRDNKKIDEIMDQAAQVRDDTIITEERRWLIINLRIAADMLSQVDEDVKSRVGIRRTGWILEAISEKLQRRRSEKMSVQNC